MDYPITIIGGGFVGSLLTIALSNIGLKVCVVEQTPLNAVTPLQDGRVSSLAFTSAQLLKALKIWPFIQSAVQPILGINVGEYQHLSLLSFGKKQEEMLPDLPFSMGYMIENVFLKKALIECLQQHDLVEYKSPATVVQITPDSEKVIVQLENGESFTTALVIGADGRHSSVRSLTGISFYERSYHQKALVTTVALEKDHQGIAFEHFLPNGPFALLPLQNQQASLVWCDIPALIEEASTFSDQAFTALLNRRFIHPVVGKLMATENKRWIYNLSVGFSPSPYTHRCVLVGDAAHAIHPVAGQGLNLGIRDVAALTDLLFEAVSLGLDVGSQTLLKRYHRQRLLDNTMMTAATDGLVRLFSNSLPPIRLFRRLGTKLVDHLPNIKNICRDYAMGLKKPLPSLLQGTLPSLV
jgi:2-octaprenyl-6-methoxyphenol hydroxylase